MKLWKGIGMMRQLTVSKLSYYTYGPLDEIRAWALFYKDGITKPMACFQDGPWFAQ